MEMNENGQSYFCPWHFVLMLKTKFEYVRQKKKSCNGPLQFSVSEVSVNTFECLIPITFVSQLIKL